MRRIINRELNVNDAKAAIENTEDPLTAMALAFLVFGRNHEFLDAHQKIQANFAKAYAGSPYVDEYNNFIMAMQSEKMLSQQSGPVQVGQPAPEISLPNPDGKSMSLSDLKGKVVLLDFWASWCGPCRRENPNVVRVYDKYKSKGFEVFSVSLDRPNGKEKWVEAIKADNLKWKYHVSDLQFWNSAPARLYGVNSIPRTFLIDKDGNIAALNLRGAESIEAELQKLL
jgi:peroxiredoxin